MYEIDINAKADSEWLTYMKNLAHTKITIPAAMDVEPEPWQERYGLSNKLTHQWQTRKIKGYKKT